MAINVSTGDGGGASGNVAYDELKKLEAAKKAKQIQGATANAKTGTQFSGSFDSSLGSAIVDRLRGRGTATGNVVDPGILDPNVPREIIGGAPITTGGRISGGATGGITEGTGGTETITGEADIEAAIGEAVDGLGAVTGDEKVAGEVSAEESTLASAIDEYIASLQAQSKLTEEASIAGIRAEETTALAGEGAARREAERQYLAQLEQIDKGVFDEIQRQKVSAQRRGIASSQQAEGIQAGVQREGLGLRFKNVQDRTVRLSNITDRINAIKSATQQKITAAGATRSAADVAAIAKGQEIGISQEFAREEREDIQAFQVEQSTKAFENQLTLVDKSFANDLEKMDISFRNSIAVAAQQNQWAMNRDAMNNAAALERLDISNEHAMDMMSLQQDYGFEMADYNFKQQTTLSNMDFERTKELAQLGEDSKMRIMDFSQDKEMDMLEFQTALAYNTEELYNLAAPTTQADIKEQFFKDEKWNIMGWEIFLPKVFGIEEKAIGAMTDAQINTRLNKAGYNAKNSLGLFGNGTLRQQQDAWAEFKRILSN